MFFFFNKKGARKGLDLKATSIKGVRINQKGANALPK